MKENWPARFADKVEKRENWLAKISKVELGKNWLAKFAEAVKGRENLLTRFADKVEKERELTCQICRSSGSERIDLPNFSEAVEVRELTCQTCRSCGSERINLLAKFTEAVEVRELTCQICRSSVMQREFTCQICRSCGSERIDLPNLKKLWKWGNWLAKFAEAVEVERIDLQMRENLLAKFAEAVEVRELTCQICISCGSERIDLPNLQKQWQWENCLANERELTCQICRSSVMQRWRSLHWWHSPYSNQSPSPPWDQQCNKISDVKQLGPIWPVYSATKK